MALYAALMTVVGLLLGAFLPLIHGGEPGIGRLFVIPASAYAPFIVTRAQDRIADLGIAMWIGTTSLWFGWLLRVIVRAGELGLAEVVMVLLLGAPILYLSVVLLATPFIVGGVIAASWIQRSLRVLLASGVTRMRRFKNSVMLLIGVAYEVGALTLHWAWFVR